MQNQIHNQNAVRTSNLGKLYEQKQGLRDINNIAESVYQSFEFFVKCGEKLPIIASPVELVGKTLTNEDRQQITDYLKQRGCVVKCPSMCSFVLVDLL